MMLGVQYLLKLIAKARMKFTSLHKGHCTTLMGRVSLFNHNKLTETFLVLHNCCNSRTLILQYKSKVY